jgi:predicted RND superfamily exporter protein
LPVVAVLSVLLLAVWFTLGAAAGFDVRLNFPLRSFGKYAVIGELSCLLTALFVLPAGLTLFRRRFRPARGATAPPTRH